MENQMKKDMIQDMHLYNNRVLLHEERVEGSKYLVVVSSRGVVGHLCSAKFFQFHM